MFEPNSGQFTSINNMTRVIIQPNISSPTENAKLTENFKGANFEEWTGCFQVENNTSTINQQSGQHSCYNLTTVEIEYKSSETKRKPSQYIATIKAVKSPMQALRIRDSSTNSIKKFLQSVENSYPESFYENTSFNDCIYALLNLDEDLLCANTKSEFSFGSNLKVKMPNFLRNQLGLFEISPKVLIKASSIFNKENEQLLSNTTKKKLKLKTNYSKKVSFFFVKCVFF